MEALTKLLAVALPLLMLGLLGMGMLLIYLAGKTMLEAKKIDLVSVAIVILILLLIPVGIREYPPMLTDAFIDAFTTIWGRSSDIEALTTKIINDSSTRWNSSGSDAPVVISTPDGGFPTAVPVAPTNMFQATATVFFATTMPSQPTATPTWSNQDFVNFATTIATKYPTPTPTIFVCQNATPEDYAQGCVPPTPIPGN